ncbi:MAG: discoidin domain-containing protein, partial [Clostridia bacterium]|nr:discoidin domain-containing protein [Clostridia bacterium]
NTAFWDMNTNQNKLYFTRFGNGSPQNIKAGDEHHTEAVWLLKYVPDAKTPEIKEPEKPDYEKFEDVKLQGKVVSLNKSYKLSGLMQHGAFQYTALLTDGKYTNSLTYDNNWFTFVNKDTYTGDQSNTENGIGYAIIDLGAKTDISGVRAHICNGGTAGILAPKGAKVFVSDDGVNFKEVATLKIAEDPTAIYWTGSDLKNVSARYVKFQFQCNGMFCFMNELEVYSK